MKVVKIDKTPEKQLIESAIIALRNGKLIIYPTETVYGLGCDATNQEAVDKLLRYKTRREGKPLSIAVKDQKMAEKYVTLNTAAKNIYKKFLPGPVTVISNSKHKVAHSVESEYGTLGIRIPDYPLVKKIVTAFGKPITATSANASYKKRPYTISDILNNIGKKQVALIELILDAGKLPTREPSTVIDTTRSEITTLRQGDIILEKEQQRTTRSEKETIELGKTIMNQYKHYIGFKAVIFCLKGEMGSGKTQLTKGIAQALGIKERITSPTYVLEQNYAFLVNKKKKYLYHADTWRMTNSKELTDLGLQKMVDESNIISIEWADRVTDIINPLNDEAKVLWVNLEYGKSENERLITWGNVKKPESRSKSHK